jgi:hypothetical protein
MALLSRPVLSYLVGLGLLAASIALYGESRPAAAATLLLGFALIIGSAFRRAIEAWRRREYAGGAIGPEAGIVADGDQGHGHHVVPHHVGDMGGGGDGGGGGHFGGH